MAGSIILGPLSFVGSVRLIPAFLGSSASIGTCLGFEPVQPLSESVKKEFSHAAVKYEQAYHYHTQFGSYSK